MRRHRVSNSSRTLGNNTDERFIRAKVAGYFSRALPAFDRLVEEDLTIAQWLLPDRDFAVVNFIGSLFEDMDPQAFQECLDDPSSYPGMLSGCVKSMGRTKVHKLKTFLHNQLAESYPDCGKSTCQLEKNMCDLGQIFNLSFAEIEVLWFFYIKSNYSACTDYFSYHLEVDQLKRRSALGYVLGLTPAELELAFGGELFTLRLLDPSCGSVDITDDCSLYITTACRDGLINELYVPLNGTVIGLQQHQITCDQTNHLVKLLSSRNSSPVHVLVYGKPGTGKSCYVRGLAEQTGLSAYEIVNGNKDFSDSRRQAISACLNITSRGSRTLIVVDEADNILNSGDSWLRRGGTMDKAWLNQLLERPNTRMIWIVNSIHGIDESVMRRFAYSLEFKPMGEEQRCVLWRNIFENNQIRFDFDDDEIKSLARTYQLSAGSIDIAVRNAKSVSTRSKRIYLNALHMGLESQERLILGHSRSTVKVEKPSDKFSLTGLSIAGDPHQIVEQVKAFDGYLKSCPDRRSMNLLFYGPPGTGKSEMAKYLASVVGRPIISRSASDILSKWVGDNERNIAEAFAAGNDGVLVFDEVDTFLYNRGLADRSWEVSAVNEFLTQMERYRGILICTTNRLEGLDKAALRRFSFKLGFDYLAPDGVLHFYKRYFDGILHASLSEAQLKELRSLLNLAPGDFKVVRDRFDFIKPGSHDDLIGALGEESRIKDCDKKRTIGFM